MTRELIEEMENLGIVERVKDFEIEKADPSKQLSLISLTREFLVFLYEAKNSPTKDKGISQVLDEHRRRDIKRALHMWRMEQESEGPMDTNNMESIIYSCLMNIEKEFSILGRPDKRNEIDRIF
jgi:hypothetical protein